MMSADPIVLRYHRVALEGGFSLTASLILFLETVELLRVRQVEIGMHYLKSRVVVNKVY